MNKFILLALNTMATAAVSASVAIYVFIKSGGCQ